MIVITQQFVLTLFRNNVLERIQVTVWTTVKKLASTTFIWCLVQKYRKNHTEKLGVPTYEWVKKQKYSICAFYSYFYCNSFGSSKGKSNQIDVGCRSTIQNIHQYRNVDDAMKIRKCLRFPWRYVFKPHERKWYPFDTWILILIGKIL